MEVGGGQSHSPVISVRDEEIVGICGVGTLWASRGVVLCWLGRIMCRGLKKPETIRERPATYKRGIRYINDYPKMRKDTCPTTYGKQTPKKQNKQKTKKKNNNKRYKNARSRLDPRPVTWCLRTLSPRHNSLSL